MGEPSEPPDRSSASVLASPRKLNLHRRYPDGSCRTTINGQHFYGATQAEILTRLIAAGFGHHPFSDQGETYQTPADALEVAKSAYQMPYYVGITPQCLKLVIDLLGGCSVNYTKGIRGRRQIVFADKFNGVLADAHLLPARRGSAAKREAMDDWRRIVPDPTPTFEFELQSFSAAPTAAGLEMLRLLMAMGG